jgi:hypothetical protein
MIGFTGRVDAINALADGEEAVRLILSRKNPFSLEGEGIREKV